MFEQLFGRQALEFFRQQGNPVRFVAKGCHVVKCCRAELERKTGEVKFFLVGLQKVLIGHTAKIDWFDWRTSRWLRIQYLS